MDDSEFPIMLTVAGMQCRVTVPRKDEGLYRDAARLIRETMRKYRERLSGSDSLLLAYTALHIAADLIMTQQSEESILKRVREVNQELDGVVED
ncbi:MAG: cell division protein ZapA [Odoribacteraceae bacterium]|jgi:cell division protein ZapA (FtsZ GTPase activity inhibitor)|nr:cell division protein ZapA [Odoribacteraceae bacterium]